MILTTNHTFFQCCDADLRHLGCVLYPPYYLRFSKLVLMRGYEAVQLARAVSDSIAWLDTGKLIGLEEHGRLIATT